MEKPCDEVIHVYRLRASGVLWMAMRDQAWLEKQLEALWQRYFADVPEYNPVRVEFGRRARTRLGSIRLDPKEPGVTLIRVTGWFRYMEVPEYVVHSVIVHELCHYAHGFHSGGEQQHKHPHAGGVVRREFAERGLGNLYDKQQHYLKNQWPDFIKRHCKPTTKRRRKYKNMLSIFG